MEIFYRFLDILIVIFHTSLTIFNTIGWIWKKTRLLNLIALTITGFSWLFLGLIYGTLGYCPLTDWHFNILKRLGKSDLPDSYIEYIIERFSGLDISSSIVDKVVLYSFLAAITLSVFFTVRDYKRSVKSY